MPSDTQLQVHVDKEEKQVGMGLRLLAEPWRTRGSSMLTMTESPQDMGQSQVYSACSFSC